MGYVRTAGMSTAARRARRRTAVVISGVLLVLVIALGVSVAYMQGWFGLGQGNEGDDSAATSVAAPPPELTPADVTVNVLNSTDVVGLAGRTSDALGDRGFDIGAVDDTDAVEGAGQIRHGPAGAEAAQLVADSVGQEVPLVDDEREDDSVDLVLGPDWEELPAPEDAEEAADE